MTTRQTAEGALSAVAATLVDVAAALTRADTDAVLALESRLAAAVADLQVSQAARPLDPATLTRAVADVSEAIAACRRLGGTVPAVLSVMFPGQVTYSRAGVRLNQLPVRSALTQVT
jgi:hypothetical protein